MIPIAPITAAIDWLESILPVLFVGFWILSQIFAIGKKLAGPQPPRDIPQPQPPAPASAPGKPLPELHEEIREFLARNRASEPPERRPRPAPRKSTRVATPPAGERRPVVVSTITDKVRQDFSKELGHLAAPLSGGEVEASHGSLGDGSAGDGSPVAVAPAAKKLVTMLRSPESMRQIILLREILDRPLERW